MTLNLPATFVFAAGILLLGELLRRRVDFLGRFNIPGPVVSGLVFATLAWIWWWRGGGALVVDTSWRTHVQSLFFATIGLNSTWPTVKLGSLRLARLWGIAVILAAIQNVTGIALALLLGASAVLGVVCGSASLMGGPATVRAFAGRFEAAGLPGAEPLGISAAAFGIIAASLLANPIATLLIRRFGEPPAQHQAAGPRDPAGLARHLLLVGAIAGGGIVAGRMSAQSMPPYIGALLLGLATRALNDRRPMLTLDASTLARLGRTLSAFFLAYAMMDLRIEQLAGLGAATIALLVCQTATTVVCGLLLIRWWIGRDYEAVVTMAGFLGFALGITPNVVANMSILGKRYGPAPQAMLVVPLVGAFLSELSNRVVIDWCLSALGK